MNIGKLGFSAFAPMLAGAAMLCTASVANAIPTIDFDVDGPGSSASIDNISGTCVACFAQTALAPGLDSEIFSLGQGQSHTFDFFSIRIGGLFANVTGDAYAELLFDLPPGTGIVGQGNVGFTTFLGILSGGHLTWTSITPSEIVLLDGSTFEVDLSDLHVFGIGNMATVQATVTATYVAGDAPDPEPPHEPPHHISEPGTLAVMGLGLAGLGFARRRKAA